MLILEYFKHYFLLTDVTNFDSFDDLAKQIDDIVKDEGLNVLFNNAGVSTKSTRLSFVKPSALLETFQTNSMGPVLLTKVNFTLNGHIIGIIELKSELRRSSNYLIKNYIQFSSNVQTKNCYFRHFYHC